MDVCPESTSRNQITHYIEIKCVYVIFIIGKHHNRVNHLDLYRKSFGYAAHELHNKHIHLRFQVMQWPFAEQAVLSNIT